MCLLVCNMASPVSTASEQGKALREVQVDWLPALKKYFWSYHHSFLGPSLFEYWPLFHVTVFISDVSLSSY